MMWVSDDDLGITVTPYLLSSRYERPREIGVKVEILPKGSYASELGNYRDNLLIVVACIGPMEPVIPVVPRSQQKLKPSHPPGSSPRLFRRS
jgi:hypothetical protein